MWVKPGLRIRRASEIGVPLNRKTAKQKLNHSLSIHTNFNKFDLKYEHLFNGKLHII